MTLELGGARARKDRGDVAKARRETVPKAIDEAGSLIAARAVDAMLRSLGGWRGDGLSSKEKIFSAESDLMLARPVLEDGS